MCEPIPGYDHSSDWSSNAGIWILLLLGLLITVGFAAVLVCGCYRYTKMEAESDVVPPWDPSGLEDNAQMMALAAPASPTKAKPKSKPHAEKSGSHSGGSVGLHHSDDVDVHIQAQAQAKSHVWIMHEVDGPGARARVLDTRLGKREHHHLWGRHLLRDASQVADHEQPDHSSATPFCQTLANALRQHSLDVVVEPEDAKVRA